MKRVAEGGYYIERELAAEVAAGRFAGDDPLDLLTERELEVLRLLGEGKSLVGIAEALGVTYQTVGHSCTRLKEKLGLKRTADLIRFSVESRLG